jgi:hypothetical protein
MMIFWIEKSIDSFQWTLEVDLHSKRERLAHFGQRYVAGRTSLYFGFGNVP